jgi:hypothetical protein
MVNPIILGGGSKLFADAGTVPLELIRVRPFQSALVLLYYRPRIWGSGEQIAMIVDQERAMR